MPDVEPTRSSSPQRTRNPATEAAHKREVLWQITVPLLILALVFFLVAALPVVALVRNQDFGIWRDIALIWLLTPNLVLALLILALIGGAAYGVIWSITQLPIYFHIVQKFFVKVQTQSALVFDQLVAPIIKLNGTGAAVRALISRSPPNKN